MTKKHWIIVLALICVLCCVFGLVACEVNNPDNPDDPNNPNNPDNPNIPDTPNIPSDKDKHTHAYSDEWKSNETHHWHECLNSGCDAKEADKAEHDFSKGNCVCGAKKPSDAEKVLESMAKAYTNSDLEALAKTVYKDGSFEYDFYIQHNSAEQVFQGYKKLQIKTAELLYDDGVDAGFNVTAVLTYETDLDKKTTSEVELKGNVYLVYKQGNWFFTEIPAINPVRKTISTRENDGAEPYYGDNIYTTVPVFVETDYSDDNNIIQKITVPTESSSLNIKNYFACYDEEWSLQTLVNSGRDNWSSSTDVFSFNMQYQWKIAVYDEYGNVAEEWDLVFKRKENITVTFYDNDRETTITTQTFMQYKKATTESAPIKDGLTFVGWTTWNGEIYDFTQRVSRNLSLYAAYVNDITQKITEGIASLDNLTLEDKTKLENIQAAIDALSDEDKALIYNYRKFEDALFKMIELEWDLKFYVDPYGSYTYYIVRAYKGSSDVVRIPEKLGNVEIRVINNNVFSGKNIKELYVPATVTSFGNQSGSLDGAVIYCASKTKPSGYSDNFAGNAATVVWNVKDTLTVDNNTFILHEDNTASLAKAALSADGTLVIPEKVNGYAVTEIEQGALDGLEINSLDVPFCLLSLISVDTIDTLIVRGVDKIDKDSFTCVKNASVKSIVLYGSATKVESNALAYYTNITEIVLPESIKSIGAYAFSGCTSLTNITIPNSVTDIGDDAFYNCPIRNAIMPTYAIKFIPLNNIETVTIAGGKVIEPSAFRYCTNLTSVTIADSVTSIGEYAFRGCTGLTTVVISNSITEIESATFGDCSSLTSLIIPDGVKSMGWYAFGGCTSLVNITIPNGVTDIADRVFDSCPIQTATIPAYAIEYIPKRYIRTVIINGGESIGDEAFSGCSYLSSVSIANGVTSIGNGAFKNCYSLTNIEIPNSVTRVGNEAFDNCNKLQYNEKENACYLGNTSNNYLVLMKGISTDITSLSIHHDTKVIYSAAFDGCRNLSTITMGSNVTHIGQYAFRGCSNLTSIEIPTSIISIDDGAFDNCNSLSYNSDASAHYLGNASNPYLVLIKVINTNSDSFIIRDDTKIIYSAAFRHCDQLTNITMPNSITSIGSSAFYYCTSLTNIEIPDSVMTIGNDAFRDCRSLTSITIPNGVIIIGDNAFSGCTGLTNITIPNSVTSIGNTAFVYCPIQTATMPTNAIKYIPQSHLQTAIITDGKSIDNEAFYSCSTLASIVIPDDITSIGSGAFCGCSNLTNFVIPNSVTSIGGKAFYGCSGLTNITLPDSITEIGGEAFSGCDGLTSITIPNSITNMGSRVFYNCSNLETVYWNASAYASEAFNECGKLTTIIIGDDVTFIDFNTFQDCRSVTNITIGANITRINDDTFERCYALTSIEIPDGVYEIGCNAFRYCSELKSITIGKGVKNIKDYAFGDCSNLAAVYYNGSSSDWAKIKIESWGNDCLKNATRYYYSEDEPALNSSGTGYNGNYWHYVDGVATVWKKEE